MAQISLVLEREVNSKVNFSCRIHVQNFFVLIDTKLETQGDMTRKK